MTGKTHMLGGLLAGTAIVKVTESIMPAGSIAVVESGIFMLSSMVTALLPDVDEKNSKAGRKLFIIPVTLGIIKTVLLFMELFTFGYIKKKIREIRKALNHRGIFHWLFTWGILSLIVCLFGIRIYSLVDGSGYSNTLLLLLVLVVGFIPGYFSHIMLDLISGKIQLLAPFNKRWYGITLVECESLIEKLLVRPVLIMAILYLIFMVK